MLKSPRLIAAIASCAAALCSQITFASNTPTFGPPEPFATTIRVNDMAMGDFDGDGIPDVAVMGDSYDTNGYPIGASMEVFFGDGSGGFRSATATIAVSFPGRIAAADVYGPAQSQLIIAGSNLVEIFNWNGANFSDAKAIDLTSTGISANFVVVGDLTKPGSRDILVTDQYSAQNGTLGMVWIPNDGTGNFGTPALIQTWGCNTRPVLADVNGDGLVDVVLDSPNSSEGGIGTNYLKQGSTVGVLTNNGNGTLSAEVLWGNQTLLTNAAGQIQGFNTAGVAVADVNGDGIADLISAFFMDIDFPNYLFYLSVNLGNGDGTFQDGQAFRVSNGIVRLDTADILGDGKTDFVTIDYPLVDQNYPGFTVTEITATGTKLGIASQTDFQTPLVDSTFLSYDTLVLGYKSTNGTFETFNNDKSVDVLLGSAQNIYGVNNTISHQFVVFENGAGTTLPPTAVLIIPPSTPGGPITFVASQPSTAAGLTVSIQYSLTPTVPSSWVPLPDGNNGHLTPVPGGSGLYSFGTVGTTFYPTGTAVYFRAVTSAAGYAPSISTNALKSYSLEQAELEIGVKLTTTSDPTGKLQVAHVGDYLTNILMWTNVGNALAVNLEVEMPVPMYIDAATAAQLQFPSNALVFNSYGKYVAATPGGKNAKVVWQVANLKPGYSQSVTLLEMLGPEVQVPSGIGLPNNYEVFSTSSQPPSPGEGPLGAPGVSVVGAISFTVVPENTTVAPGGLLTYTFTLSNLTSVAVPHPMVAIVVPPHTRFATSYPTGANKSVAGVTEFGNGIPGTTYKHIFYDNSDKSLVLINFGGTPGKGLAAYPNKSGLDAISFNVVFQAQWGIPSTVPNIIGSDYVASFLAPTVYTRLFAEYLAAGDTAATPTTNDFTALLSATSPSTVFSEDESGLITIPLKGNANGGPLLHLLKTLSAGVSALDINSGGKTVDAVLTNGLITFVLTAYNNGPSDAQDVFIEDTMPNSCAYLSNSLLFATPKTKSTPSTLSSATNGFTVVQDPDGHHLRFEGLRVEAGDNVSLEYTVRVFDGAKPNQPAPPPLTFLDPAVAIDSSGLPDPASIGSSTTYNTWVGTYLSQPIEVVSTNQFANPIIRALVPHPAVSTNVADTGAILTAFYGKYPNSIPLTNANDPSSFYPGMERYYIHYQNNGRAVTGAKLDVPLPANTAFLRAAFVKLTPNATPGTLPYLPGVIIPNPSGAGITLPTGTSDTVTFELPTLAVGASNDVMVEVIITPGAVQTNGALVGDPTALPVVIYDKNVKTPSIKERTKGSQYFDPNQAFSFYRTQPVSASTVPQLGIMIIAPQQVHPGDTFNVSMTMYNLSDVDTSDSILDFYVPNNTTYVTNDHDAPTVIDANLGDPAGSELELPLTTYLATDPDNVNGNPFTAHTAAGFMVTLKATGDVGSTISAFQYPGVFTTDEISLLGNEFGYLAPPPFTITIVDPSIPLLPLHTLHTGVALFQPLVESEDVSIIDIGVLNGIDQIVASGAGNIVASGAGNIVASGAGNIVASGAGNIVASGAGNIVASGAGNLISIGSQNGAYYVANQASIVASGAGNIIAADAAKIVASGAGNIVASGAGNLSGADGSSIAIVASGAGNVAATGTTIEIQSADNVEMDGEGITAAADGGAIISAGAGKIVSTNGSNERSRGMPAEDGEAKAVGTAPQTTGFILTSAPGSKVLIRTPSGNTYSAGGAIYAPNPSP